MALPHGSPNSVFHLFDSSLFGNLLLEQGSVDILRTVLPSSPDNDCLSLFFPFQYGPWTYAEFSPYFQWYRQLALGCDSRTNRFHAADSTTVMRSGMLIDSSEKSSTESN